ncbi:MAG TPA: DNRLRE domain-containing protein [Caldilineaceae bacterium]|nr:DNRLRE domain-containing protein [Caldilineaceae bacterium]
MIQSLYRSRRHSRRHTRGRLAHRLLRVLFALLVVAPAELPVLLPPPAVAAPAASSEPSEAPAPEDDPADLAIEQEDKPGAPIQAVAEPATSPAPVPSTSDPDLLPAFMQTVELDGGERAAVLSSDPVNYLDPDGEWRPIDPRFTQQVDGFDNLTNLMQIRTGARQALLDVSHGALQARWTPQALLLADETREAVLAKPAQSTNATLAADGRTVVYAGSWTLPELSDEVTAGPGEAEHNVLFAQLPTLPRSFADQAPGVGARLVLRARLELPPGGQLWAEGVQQSGAFSTTGAIELRDHAGTTRLRLAPAVVFEQARPDQQITATYHVVPTDLRSWEVRMETPWSWWADADRRYPVVWDPLMQVLRALSVAQIYAHDGCAPYLLSAPDLTGVGRATCYLGPLRIESPVRTLLRFDQIGQINLPPGAQIQGAVLLVAPTDGYINITANGQYNPCVSTQLHRVTSSWDPNSVNWGNQPQVDPNPFRSSSTSYAGRTDPPLCFYGIPQGQRHSGTKYLLQDGPTGIVTDWINGGANHGLELRGTPAEENGCGPRGLCDFVRIPKRSVWPRSDRDQTFGNDFESMEGGGFMLIIRYRGPALENNTPYLYSNFNPVPKPPKFENEDFHRTRHHYLLPPPTGSPWLAVGVKGYRNSITYLREVTPGQFVEETKTGLFSYNQWTQTGDGGLAVAASGEPGEVNAASPDEANLLNLPPFNFPLAVAPESCTSPACEQPRSEGNESRDGSNFILVSAGAAAGRELRVDPPKGDPKLEQYAVEGSWSTPLPPVTADQVGETGVRYQYTVTVDTGHIVQAYHLELPENVRLGLSTRVTVVGLTQPTASAVTHLFPPGNGIFPKTNGHKQAENGQTIRTLIAPGTGGAQAIVVELPGDKTAFDRCSPNVDASNYCPPGAEDPEPKDRTLQVVFTVQVCPINGIPTDTGCALVVKPDWSQTDLWRQVGPYRIFSPAGFEDCVGVANAVCSRRYVGAKEYASIITWGERIERAAIVAGVTDPFFPNRVVSFRTNFDPYLSAVGIVHLGKCDPSGELLPFFEIYQGGLYAGIGGLDLNSGVLDGGACADGTCNALILSEFDKDNYFKRSTPVSTTSPTVRISMVQSADDTTSQYAEFTARIVRPLNTISGVQDQLLRITWRVRAEGYQGWSESPGGTGPTDVKVVQQSSVAQAPVAGLTYQFSPTWDGYYNPAVGYFTHFRNENGVITHRADLGGAWNFVDYVVLPHGEAPGGGSGLALCGSFCGDVRAPDDTWAAPNRQWKMPDVLVNQLPNTVMVSSPGNLQVYSTDHPTSIGATNDTYGFSFKTFGAKVELTNGVCPDGSSNQPVELIKGTTSLSLPGLDPKADPSAANSAIPSITATFVLCENALRQVSLTFSYPPGIPVAAPPVMYVDMIGGTVTIGPSHTVIQLDVGFYIGTGVPKVFKGSAKLTLDTRGLFSMQATGRVMGMMDGEGHLWVAWNPLDTGIGSQGWLPNKNDWIVSGFIYAHVWRGSGWQNRYPWLAGNDDLHLTASYQATFRIKEGAALDEWPLVIPPGDISIGVELSFGQFCANDACTDYEWGIKGKVEIIGFDVGIYVNLECPALLAAVVLPPAVLLCTSFILGSDDHLLIDQYGGGGPPFPLEVAGDGEAAGPETSPADVQETDAWLAQAKRVTVADPAAPQVDQPLTVNPTAASILVGFGWVRGAPKFSLVRPDGTVITAANAASLGVAISTTANSQIFGIDQPQAGQWLARVTNATINDDYRIVYFANKATPPLAFTAPTGLVEITAAGDSTAAQLYRIQWTPPPNADQLRMSLFYSATVANATSPTYLYGGVIRENIDPTTGFFDWDLSHLASGDYRIYATLQDDRGSRVSELGTDQYVGVTTSIAPGTLRYVDKTPPPIPNAGSVVFTPAEDGLIMCWDVSPAHDLSEYLITYDVDTIFLVPPRSRTIQERVLAVVPYAPGAKQCMRMGGLVAEETQINFPTANHGLAARDASGNISGFSQPPSTELPAGATHDGPPPPVLAGVANGGNVTLSWPADPSQRAWDLFYARETYAGPHAPGSGAAQGNSPININELDFTGDYTLTGLARGYWYAFAVRAYGRSFLSPPSLLSNQVWLLVTDGVDANGDGCPDDWQSAHDLPNGAGNPDGDGLTNAQECRIGTNPYIPDTDGDNVVDGVEVSAGTNPLDPASYPQLTPAQVDAGALPPIMGLSALRLSFHAFTQGPNPPDQPVMVFNLGNASFTPGVASDQPWLLPSVVGNQIVVKVNTAGLGRGNYTGHITVSANPASTLGAPQTITVDLAMLAGSAPGQVWKMYVPTIGSRFTAGQ